MPAHLALRIQQHIVQRKPAPLQEAAHPRTVLALVQEHDVQVRILPLRLGQHRHLPHAVRTPRRPQVHDGRAPIAEALQRHCLPIQRLQLQRRQRLHPRRRVLQRQKPRHADHRHAHHGRQQRPTRCRTPPAISPRQQPGPHQPGPWVEAAIAHVQRRPRIFQVGLMMAQHIGQPRHRQRPEHDAPEERLYRRRALSLHLAVAQPETKKDRHHRYQDRERQRKRTEIQSSRHAAIIPRSWGHPRHPVCQPQQGRHTPASGTATRHTSGATSTSPASP